MLVRYEIEKMLIEEDLEVEKLPQIWNDKYEEYLGVRPSTDREGVLQDIHWSQGSIGYFPSYALGNAFGAQIYHQMKKELPVEKLLEAGNLGEIREYLRKNIHQYGKLKDSRQILRDMTGEDFNPSYYVAYLEEGMNVSLAKRDGSIVKSKIKELHTFEGMGRSAYTSVQRFESKRHSHLPGYQWRHLE